MPAGGAIFFGLRGTRARQPGSTARSGSWAVLGFAAALCVSPASVLAQEQEEDEGLEEEFAFLQEALATDEVQSASKHRQSIFWSPSAISVYTQEDIRRSGAETLTDFLRRVPGFDIYEMKPTYPLVGARALTDEEANLILLLVDGRESMIELAGFPVWAALSIALDEVERIEVIRGPGSALYGANAFAGIVSITTVPGRAITEAQVRCTAGEQGYRNLHGLARSGFDLFGGRLSFGLGLGTEAQQASSDRQDEVKLIHRTHGQVRYQNGSTLDLSLHAGSVWADGTFHMLIGDIRVTDVVNHFEMGRAEVDLGKGSRLTAQFYHNRYYAEFHFRNRVEAFGTWLADLPDLYGDTHSLDGQVQVDLQLHQDLLLIGGGNIRYTTMVSDKFIPNQLTELRGAGFVHAQWATLEKLQLTGGLRLDLNSRTGPAWSPRLVAVFQPWPNQALRLGYGLAFRKPSFIENQLHLLVEEVAFPEVREKLRASIGNENLVNEKVHSVEAGWRGRLLDGRLSASLDLFYNIYLDMITFKSEMTKDSLGRPDLLNSTLMFINQEARVVVLGGEAEVAWQPSPTWMLWANAGLRAVVSAGSGALSTEPRLRVNLGGRYTPGGRAAVDLALHYVSSYRMSLVDSENPLEQRRQYFMGDNLLLIARLGYQLSLGGHPLEVGITVRSPVGASFREYPGVPMQWTDHSLTATDFGGEPLRRMVALYLRGSY